MAPSQVSRPMAGQGKRGTIGRPRAGNTPMDLLGPHSGLTEITLTMARVPPDLEVT